MQICFTDLPHPCLARPGWCNNARLLGFATRCVNLQKPRYRPWVTAPSLLLLTCEIATIASMALSREMDCRLTILRGLIET